MRPDGMAVAVGMMSDIVLREIGSDHGADDRRRLWEVYSRMIDLRHELAMLEERLAHSEAGIACPICRTRPLMMHVSPVGTTRMSRCWGECPGCGHRVDAGLVQIRTGSHDVEEGGE